MKTSRISLLIGLCLLACGARAENICISTQNTMLVIDASKGSQPKFVYYGRKIPAADVENLRAAGSPECDAYPVYGLYCDRESALSVKQADGNMTLQMGVTETSERHEQGAKVTVITMRDYVYPFTVSLCYRAYTDVDMIEAWTEITNGGRKTVCLNRFDSAVLPVRRGDVWISHLYGSWANEARVSQERLTPGTLLISNKDGVRNSHTSHSEVMFSLDGKPSENSGRTIGAALCYGGNYELRVNTHDDDYHRLFAGICPENSAYNLSAGETFTTPELALTFSAEGMSGVSRNFHKWARKHKLAHGERERKILLNSWEGVYFDINEQGMAQMMKDIVGMGGELFVMDDGWFGDKYPRKSDNSSLGDWTVDRTKLPNGIASLVKEAEGNGIKFGIWIEPEMTNTKSELFEKHPDWVIKAPQRDLVAGRGGTQLVLDLSNPKVQDFVFKIVDDLMTQNPDIDYIKWDANMSISNHGSQYLPADRQSHLYIEYHKGLVNVCKRIRAKYPDITIQDCASGGGRANYGLLPYFDEFWVSDNTDALQRVYMQWGTSYFFPAIAMASHISAAPNHQTFRTIPLKYRIDVAMSGRLGMEIQPKNMTEDEIALCRKAIAEYKEIRPVVQFGDIYRLLSPYDKLGAASLMYVSEDKQKAVFYWWKTESFVNEHLPRVVMQGLDAKKSYRVKELDRIDNAPLPFEGKSFSGEYLMANGLEIPYRHTVDYNKQNDWASRVIYLEAAD